MRSASIRAFPKILMCRPHLLPPGYACTRVATSCLLPRVCVFFLLVPPPLSAPALMVVML